MTSSGGGPSQGTAGSTGWGGPTTSHHGDTAHGKGGRFDVANTKTTTTSTKDGDDAREKYISTKKYPKRYKTVETHVPHTDIKVTTKIRDYYDPKGYQKRAPKTKEEKSLLDKIAWGIAIFTGLAPILGVKVPGIVATTGKVLGYRKNIDMALNLGKKLDLIGDHVTTDSLADSFVEKFKDRKSKMDEYKSLPPGHPDKIALGIELEIGKTTDDGEGGDGPEPQLPQVVPVHEEIDAYEGTYAMSPWDRIKANQASRAAAIPDWQLTAEERELKNNPVVDESVTDITMQANKGGLANLFRVKNQ